MSEELSCSKDHCDKFDAWGDDLGQKSKENIRITFQNVNGFLATAKEDNVYKPRQIYDFMTTHNIDLHAMVEMNTNWRLTPKKYSINELSRCWFENQRLTTAYNMQDKICRLHQPGGSAMISQGELALRCARVQTPNQCASRRRNRCSTRNPCRADST